jgi:Domain of unknown function (DUF6791)
MSGSPIKASPDLQRLREEGYDIALQAGFLLMRSVPYVDASGQVRRGTLLSTLTLAGERTDRPDTHVAMFQGEFPCDAQGAPLEPLRSSGAAELAAGLHVDFAFSSKPDGGYLDYHAKMTTYAAILESQAQVLEPGASARTYPPAVPDELESTPFRYLDTATSRAGIGVASGRLALGAVAIIGLGGTGSYVLDMVAKTPVWAIHLFDGDVLLSHNAFRAPGAASLQELQARPAKVDYWASQYEPLRGGIVPHPYDVDEGVLHELAGMDFVFICIDGGPSKRLIVERLEQLGTAFVDVGMGISMLDGALAGTVRASMSIPANRFSLHSRAGLDAGAVEDEYAENIQIADLNALNACLAVIKWKKLFGFYRDSERELHSTYTIETDLLLSEDPHDKDTQA